MEKKQNSSLGLLLTMQRWSWGEGGCQLLSSAALIVLSRLHLLNPTIWSWSKQRQATSSTHEKRHFREDIAGYSEPKQYTEEDLVKQTTSSRLWLSGTEENEPSPQSEIVCIKVEKKRKRELASIFFAAPLYLPILHLLAQYTLHDIEHKPLMNKILKCKEGRTKTKTSSKKTNFAQIFFDTSGEEEDDGIRFQKVLIHYVSILF